MAIEALSESKSNTVSHIVGSIFMPHKSSEQAGRSRGNVKCFITLLRLRIVYRYTKEENLVGETLSLLAAAMGSYGLYTHVRRKEISIYKKRVRAYSF